MKDQVDRACRSVQPTQIRSGPTCSIGPVDSRTKWTDLLDRSSRLKHQVERPARSDQPIQVRSGPTCSIGPTDASTKWTDLLDRSIGFEHAVDRPEGAQVALPHRGGTIQMKPECMPLPMGTDRLETGMKSGPGPSGWIRKRIAISAIAARIATAHGPDPHSPGLRIQQRQNLFKNTPVATACRAKKQTKLRHKNK